MKVKNEDIFGALKGDNALMTLLGQKLPVGVSYKLSKLGMRLREEMKAIEEVRLGLIKKHGEEEKRKGHFSITEESPNWERFFEEFRELMSQEVDLGKMEKVKLPLKIASTCDSCHHNMDRSFEIEASILLALDPFVEVDGAG